MLQLARQDECTLGNKGCHVHTMPLCCGGAHLHCIPPPGCENLQRNKAQSSAPFLFTKHRAALRLFHENNASGVRPGWSMSRGVQSGHECAQNQTSHLIVKDKNEQVIK